MEQAPAWVHGPTSWSWREPRSAKTWVAIIDHGRIRAIDSPRELIGQLADSGSIEFATSAAVEIAELARLSSVNDVKVNGAASAIGPATYQLRSRSHARRCRRYSTGLSSAASSCAASKSFPAPSKTSSSSSPAASCGSDRL